MSESLFTDLQLKTIKANPEQKSKVRASGTVTIGNLVNVRFTVVEGKNGPFVKLPNHTFQLRNPETGKNESKWAQDVRIIGEDNYKSFINLILSEYKNKADGQPVVASNGDQNRPARDDKTF